MTGTMRDVTAIDRPPIKSSAIGRLFEGQTAIDFVGKRKVGAAISGALLPYSFGRLMLRSFSPRATVDVEDAIQGAPSGVISLQSPCNLHAIFLQCVYMHNRFKARRPE